MKNLFFFYFCLLLKLFSCIKRSNRSNLNNFSINWCKLVNIDKDNYTCNSDYCIKMSQLLIMNSRVFDKKCENSKLFTCKMENTHINNNNLKLEKLSKILTNDLSNFTKFEEEKLFYDSCVNYFNKIDSNENFNQLNDILTKTGINIIHNETFDKDNNTNNKSFFIRNLFNLQELNVNILFELVINQNNTLVLRNKKFLMYVDNNKNNSNDYDNLFFNNALKFFFTLFPSKNIDERFKIVNNIFHIEKELYKYSNKGNKKSKLIKLTKISNNLTTLIDFKKLINNLLRTSMNNNNIMNTKFIIYEINNFHKIENLINRTNIYDLNNYLIYKTLENFKDVIYLNKYKNININEKCIKLTNNYFPLFHYSIVNGNKLKLAKSNRKIISYIFNTIKMEIKKSFPFKKDIIQKLKIKLFNMNNEYYNYNLNIKNYDFLEIIKLIKKQHLLFNSYYLKLNFQIKYSFFDSYKNTLYFSPNFIDNLSPIDELPLPILYGYLGHFVAYQSLKSFYSFNENDNSIFEDENCIRNLKTNKYFNETLLNDLIIFSIAFKLSQNIFQRESKLNINRKSLPGIPLNDSQLFYLAFTQSICTVFYNSDNLYNYLKYERSQEGLIEYLIQNEQFHFTFACDSTEFNIILSNC